MPERPRRPRPLDPPMVPFTLAGTGGWAVAGVVLLLADAPSEWLWTCLAGVLVGLALLALMSVRDRRSGRAVSRGRTPRGVRRSPPNRPPDSP